MGLSIRAFSDTDNSKCQRGEEKTRCRRRRNHFNCIELVFVFVQGNARDTFLSEYWEVELYSVARLHLVRIVTVARKALRRWRALTRRYVRKINIFPTKSCRKKVKLVNNTVGRCFRCSKHARVFCTTRCQVRVLTRDWEREREREWKDADFNLRLRIIRYWVAYLRRQRRKWAEKSTRHRRDTRSPVNGRAISSGFIEELCTYSNVVNCTSFGREVKNRKRSWRVSMI